MEIATYRFLDGEGISVEDGELDMVPIVVYKSIAVHVLKYGTAIWEKQILRCTLEAHWHGSPPRHDWVWWRACRQSRVMSRQPSESPVPPLPWKALKGRLPVRLISLFKFSIMKDGMAMPDLQLAFVQTTNMVAGGAVERFSGMVKVARAAPGTEYRLVHASQIDGAAHLIPFDPDNTTNCAWLVNSHIDLETWNEVTMDEDQMDEDLMDEDDSLEETAGQSVMADSDSESDSTSDNSETSQW